VCTAGTNTAPQSPRLTVPESFYAQAARHRTRPRWCSGENPSATGRLSVRVDRLRCRVAPGGARRGASRPRSATPARASWWLLAGGHAYGRGVPAVDPDYPPERVASLLRTPPHLTVTDPECCRVFRPHRHYPGRRPPGQPLVRRAVPRARRVRRTDVHVGVEPGRPKGPWSPMRRSRTDPLDSRTTSRPAGVAEDVGGFDVRCGVLLPVMVGPTVVLARPEGHRSGLFG